MSATLVAPRPVDLSADIAGSKVFRVSLALFVAVAVARVHGILPGLANVPLIKLLTVPMLLATIAAVPRWQVLFALRTTSARSVGVLAALAVMSIPLSVWPGNSIRLLTTAVLPSLLLFVVASTGFADRRTARVCVIALVVCAGADALYITAGLAPLIQGRAYIGGGLDPNDSAALFVTTLPFAMLLASERGRNRWLGLGVALLIVAGTAKTGSRGGFVGLIAVALVLTLRAVSRRRWVYVIGITACAAAFALAANETLASRFKTIAAPQADYNTTSSEGRIEIWKRGLGYMVTHPVLGVGLGGFETAEGTLSGKVNIGFGLHYSAAHNVFIQIGAELGVFGLVALITAFWSAIAGCGRARRLAQQHRSEDPRRAEQEMNLADAASCALVGIVTTGFFLSLAYHPMTFFPIAVASGVAAGSPYLWRGLRA